MESSGSNSCDRGTRKYFAHYSASTTDTVTTLAATLHQQFPDLALTIAAQYSSDLLSYAAAGHATCTPISDEDSSGLPPRVVETSYLPPPRRLDGNEGYVGENVYFGKYMYKWQNHEYIIYQVQGMRGQAGNFTTREWYILSPHEADNKALLLAAGSWANKLHGEIWVFDSGRWMKNAELYRSVMKASWDAVILDEKMKTDLINDHLYFFRSRETYGRLKVPWKRGVIYHGPPGNGKTISIKAMMHSLYKLDPEVPTLYVRSLQSIFGREYSIQAIFAKARAFAPCYLVFEDLDSIVDDSVRSYFLNEVDGIKVNDGIFMVGSTNHLELLDPGISKRPSRFDRKYFFPNPDFDQRVAYCRFWQEKLRDNKDVEFPDELCPAIAGITDAFSFAYIQEAFVATLLAIARGGDKDAKMATAMDELALRDDWVDVTADDDLDDLVLWLEIQKQVKILRDAIGDGEGGK